MDKKDVSWLPIMNSCMILMFGIMSLGLCILLYAQNLSYQGITEMRMEGLRYRIEMLREDVDRIERERSGKDHGITPL